jgi:predicted ATPase/DNA-binding SARP family transcriptional activator
MDFRILGPLEVEAGGQTLPLGGPKQRALLALLLTQANRVVSIERLSEGLWGDSPPARAAATIQVYVSQLRKQLERDRKPGHPYQILVNHPPGYFLRLGPDELDVYRFEHLQEVAASALTDGDAYAAAASFRQALGLWRGPALADFAAEPWALGEADRLNDLRLHTLEQRVEADLALARHAELIPELEGMVAEYPFRERLCGQLMLALYRSGRQAEASILFQRTRLTLVEQLGMEPGPELQKLLRQILKQDPELNAPPPPLRSTPPPQGRLPAPLTRFVGRQKDLEEVRSRIAASRLVTVLGIGGVGKTRLAIETGGRLASSYLYGIRYVDLAPLSNAGLLPQAFLSALGLRDQSGEDILLVIVNHLASKELLLIIDNCEHVAEAAARLVETVLMLCPEIHVLATSRERLGIQGETVYRLQGLLLESESVSLFLDRARAVSSSFEPTEEQLDAIQQVCERLDGIPLAIELAAARLTVMTPHEILQRLDGGHDLLTTGPRTAAERQRTLTATIDWSYRLLTDAEQELFRKISVCRGWFGLDAAEDVYRATGESNGLTADVLARLVDKSMLVPGVGDKLGRCRMLETVREFANLHLERSGEATATTRRHAEHYLALVELAAPHFRTPDQRRWLNRVGDEYDNVRVAFEWSVANDPQRGLKAVAALENFWFRGRQTEGRYWASRLLRATEGYQGRARADALYVAAWLSWMQAATTPRS